MSYFNNAGGFLIHTILGFYIVILILRFLFQYVRIDFYNPVSRFLIKATDPVLKPLRRLIPGLYGIDVSSLVMILLITMIEQTALLLLNNVTLGILPLLLMSLAEVLKLFIHVFLYAILIHIILSWVAPGSNNPIAHIVYNLSEPLLRPAKNLIPPIGGLDLSPIAVMIFLQLTTMLIVKPIQDYGILLLLG